MKLDYKQLANHCDWLAKKTDKMEDKHDDEIHFLKHQIKWFKVITATILIPYIVVIVSVLDKYFRG